MFTKLIIHHFFSIEHAEIPLKDLGLVFIEGKNESSMGMESNGAGKSSIFEALLWGLYENTIRGFRKDEVINDKLDGGCYVEIHFENGWIRRSRKHEEYGTGFEWSFSALSNEIKSEQEAVSNLVGLDYDGFLYTLMMGQGSGWLLSEANDSSQKKLYESIVLSEDLFPRKEKIEKEIVSQNTEYLKLTTRLSDKKLKIQDLSNQIELMKTQYQSWESERSLQLNVKLQEFETLKVKVSELEDLVKSQEGKRDSLISQRDTIVSLVNSLTLHIQQCDSNLTILSGQISLKSSEEGNRKELELLFQREKELSRQILDEKCWKENYGSLLIEKKKKSLEERVSLAEKLAESNDKINDFKTLVRGLESEIYKLENDPKVQSFSLQIESRKKSIEKLRLELDQPIGSALCPTCRNPVDEILRTVHISNDCQKLEGEIQSLQVERENLEKNIQLQIQEKRSKIEEYSTVQLEKDVLSMRERVKALQEDKEVKEIESKIETVSNTIEEKTSSLTSVNVLKASFEEKIRSTESLPALTVLQDINTQTTEVRNSSISRKSESEERERTLSNQISMLDSDLKDSQDILSKSRIFFSSVSQEIGSLKTKPNPYDYSSKESEKVSLDFEVSLIPKQIEEVSLLIEHLQFLKEMFGDKGLKSYLLDYIVDPLNSWAEYYSKILTGGTIKVKFSTTKELKSGETRECFNISIQNELGASDYKGNSAGEKKRANLVILKAVRELIRERSSKNLNISFNDEFTDSLDQVGMNSMFSLMEQEVGERGTVFAISHDSSWKARFLEKDRKIITVTKDQRGVSHVSFNWTP